MNSFDSKAQRSTWRTLVATLVVAVAFNLVWELAQAPLYVGVDNFRKTWWI